MKHFFTFVFVCLFASSFAQQSKQTKTRKHPFTASFLCGTMPYKVTASNANERIYIKHSFFYGAGLKYSSNINKYYNIDIGVNGSINSFDLRVKSISNNSDYTENVPDIPILGSWSFPLSIHRKIYVSKKLYLTAGAGIAYNYYSTWGASILSQDQLGKREIMEWKLWSTIGDYHTNLMCAELHLGSVLKVKNTKFSINWFLSIPNKPILNSGDEYTVYDPISKNTLGKGIATNPGKKMGIHLGFSL